MQFPESPKMRDSKSQIIATPYRKNHIAGMTSGLLARVRFSNSSASTSRPCAIESMKCNEGWVRPRSSFEIEDTSQRHASANATCDSPCSKRSSFSANPNASSVFNPCSVAGIDQVVYRNIFLSHHSIILNAESSKIHVDDSNLAANTLL